MTATLERPAPGRAGARRSWLALAVVVVLAVVAVVLLGRSDSGDDGPLSTTSTRPDGARALARLLEARGTDVREVSTLADARSGGDRRTVLVLDPAAYTADQLRALAAGTAGPLVLLSPDDAALRAVGAELVPVTDTLGVTGTIAPGCDDPAALAAGPVSVDGAQPYAGPRSTAVCYGGAFARDGRTAVLGDPTGLTNARLDETGAAALALNVLGQTDELVWVRPGADAAGGATGSVWSALPDHAEAAALWLLAVGLLLVLWRARRLGPPVGEPLPVVVRADEIVRGLARLYARAEETPRSAAVLRAATVTRLRRSLALPPSTPVADVAHATARRLGGDLPPGLLDGPPPADGDGLLRLARDLAEVEDRVRRADGTGRAG